MATWFDNSAGGVMDALLLAIGGTDASVGAREIHLLDDYTEGQDRATILGGANALATVAIADGNFSAISDDVGNSRRMSFTGISGTTSNDSSTENLHVAITNATDVLLVTKATNQPITSGNPVTFSTFYFQVNQPAQA